MTSPVPPDPHDPQVLPPVPLVVVDRPPLGGVAPSAHPYSVPPSGWQPVPTPAPDRPQHRGRAALVVTGVLVVLALLAGAVGWGLAEVRRGAERSGSATGVPLVPARPDSASSSSAAARRIVVQGGDPADPGVELVKEALADVDAFWRRNFAKVSPNEYRTVSGGFVAYGDGTTVPPCTDDPTAVAGNAFYCTESDAIAWDSVQLVPRLRQQFGDLGVGLVFAHEWGHAVQLRAGVTDRPTIFMEQQADCYAGAWVADARRRDDAFKVTPAALDRAMSGFLTLRDPVGLTDSSTPGAHGSAFDRIRAFQEGVADGVERCAGYQLDRLPLVARGFTSFEDQASGGNLPLQDTFDITEQDLGGYWPAAARSLGASSFTAPRTELSDSTDCRSAVRLAGRVVVCPSDGVVRIPSSTASTAHDAIGDFSLSSLLGAGWAAAALVAADRLPAPGAARQRAVDCLNAAWARTVFDGSRQGAQFSLSPGDLDEAVRTLLESTSSRDRRTTGSGFDRVTAYRRGFVEGASACVR